MIRYILPALLLLVSALMQVVGPEALREAEGGKMWVEFYISHGASVCGTSDSRRMVGRKTLFSHCCGFGQWHQGDGIGQWEGGRKEIKAWDLGIHVCRGLSCAPPHSSCSADHTKEVVFAPEAALRTRDLQGSKPSSFKNQLWICHHSKLQPWDYVTITYI